MSDSVSLLEAIDSSQAAHEVTANQLIAAMSIAAAYGRHAEACAGLTWAWYGVRYGGTAVANGSSLLTASTVSYMVAHRTTGAVSLATGTTNWNDSVTYGRCYKIVTGVSTVTSYEDHRFGPGGVFASSDDASVGTVTSVNVIAPAAGITATGGPVTTTGSVTLALANDLAAVEGLATTGLVRRTSADTWSAGTAVGLTTEVTGILPIANMATGTPDGSKFVRDDGVLAVPSAVGSRVGLAFEKEFALSDLTTAITTGTTKGYWRPAFAATGVSARLSLRVASSSGIPTVDMNKAGATMMSTKLTIDASELTSVTAAAAVVMSSTTFAADDLIEWDIDVAGTGAMGLIVTVTGLYA